ncbi:hypothetical protein SAMN06298224_1283 [Fibrobacter sp. UWB16]|uniref:hypothetical protein n=1 Tax=Fibrobacter sp. UWB16 TaxID=1945874 RepID=UPI000BD7353A|nr:hypothetical protein [Fibrobacter sp. UWB16]SOD13559.1 hypothetical protein SAMN06298224_1283 [Fibrobacter sp. UWB16]
MKKIHLTRFAAMATVALMGSTAAWAASGTGWSTSESTLTLQSNTNDAVSISGGEFSGINKIIVARGAASAEYSTLMLPAEVNISESDEITDVYVPTGYVMDDKTLDFSRVESGTISANTPYLVHVTGSPESFTFTKSSGTYNIVAPEKNEYSTTLERSCWDFTGSYAKKYWATAPANIYGYAAAAGENYGAGQFVKVGENVTLPPLRAYLTCTNKGFGKSSTDNVYDNLPDVIKVRLLDKSGETLSIGTMNTRTGEIQMQDRYYDLKGRKLNGKPQNKIMYVNKKVIKH